MPSYISDGQDWYKVKCEDRASVENGSKTKTQVKVTSAKKKD
jgi:hypothetical protein